ncbi:sensor domain-containing diguanylate cyclase [Aquabacterium sp.]|uniref:sensor domain-containing diguanylate cyclase n=1 Tax=Aquabacterium sp. TaxID=1872578 RepID=UPI002489E17B|nr:sensor domain-containing diguanylate cyclase [Aquabacterium sp.]MDI1257801.1 sensor domain-containing diguanylate cyclase [Aquabacterium sp.]
MLTETERLMAVRAHEILDTAPEAEFDALANLAAQLAGVPLAWLAFMGESRWWCKSSVGLGDREWHQGLSLEDASGVQESLVCEELRRDARFEHHPWVAGEPGLRFYASAPIVDQQGHALGTIAVADIHPRAFTEGQKLALADLATLAMAVLDGRQRARQLSHLAKTDHLTGVANRAQFDLALDVEMRHSMRAGEPFTVLCMDLDGFKEIVDGFGHAAGDAVLCEVSRRLNQQVRLGDVLARLGSDEFGVVMRHGAKDSAEVLAKRIVRSVCQPITLPTGDAVGVGISVGIAAYNDSVESVRSLLAQADQALYDAKKQNERRWKMFVGGR